MSDYNDYPAVNDSKQFPPQIRQAIANSAEVQAKIAAAVNSEEVIDILQAKMNQIVANSGVISGVHGGVPPEELFDVEGGLTLEREGLSDVMTWLSTRADGGVPRYIAENLLGVVVMDSPTWAWAQYYVGSRTVKRGIMHDGTEFNMGGASSTPQTLRCFYIWGQSNAVGKDGDPIARLDPGDKRIYMSTLAGDIVPAVEPVISRDSQSSKGWVLEFGRLMARKYPDDAILLINGSFGGVGFFSPAAPSAQRWNPTDPDPNLYNYFLTQITNAHAKAALLFKNILPTAIIGDQGEADRAHPESTYAPILDMLIAGVRSHLGDTTVPYIHAQVAREYVDTWSQKGVNYAHINLPGRVERSAFAPSEYGWVKYDGIHFSRDGYNRRAKAIADALDRAATNIPGNRAEQVLDLRARRVGTDVLVDYTMPSAPIDGVTIDWNSTPDATDATSGWQTTGVSKIATLAWAAKISSPGGSVITVRVRTVSGAFTSLSNTYTV